MDTHTSCTLTINIELSGITPTDVETIRHKLQDTTSFIDSRVKADPMIHANVVVEGTKRETYFYAGAF